MGTDESGNRPDVGDGRRDGCHKRRNRRSMEIHGGAFANPIGVIVAAIIAAIAAVYALVKAFSWFNSSTEKAKENLKNKAKNSISSIRNTTSTSRK